MTIATEAARRPFALRFISGKYQGDEFPIAPDREIVLGRSNDLDVVLVEDMVSRRHAKISYTQDALLIEDLGSTNGTFVNGEKIKRARLKEGDRVLIGTSIVRVVVSDLQGPQGSGEREYREAEARARMQTAAQRPTQAKMSGTIDEVPLVDLLQLFATSKKSGVLKVTREDDQGRVVLRKGQVVHASINDNTELGPLKSTYRMLIWEEGFFELDPPDEREFSDELNLSTEAILMEGIRQLDELRRLKPMLPAPPTRVSIPLPLQPPLKDLNPTDLSVFQLALNWGRFGLLLDRSKMTDLETSESFLRLVQRGYLKTE
jgi:pSer/pThr/pTyr-binding forkhead associated (FHA) protein